MAIARLSMKVGKAGKASPHSAYIARTGQYANRLERGERLAATESGNMPAWAVADPGAFWLAADANERKNGTTYREMEIALPRELDTAQQVALVRDWVAQELGDKHAYQWAIHVPTAADGGEQPHVHLMFSERQRDGIERDPEQYFKRYNAKAPEKGGARKGYGPDAGQTKTKAERVADLKAVRERWELACNQHLERAGADARIDMRSHADAGIEDAPERKQLPSQWRGQGRADVIELRAAKAEQREAGQAAQVIVLAERRKALTAALPPAEAVKQWDAQVNDLAKQYRARADRLEDRMRGQIEVIEKQREQKRVEHAKKKPVEPSGLFAGFKRAGYQAAMGVWQATGRELMNWGFRRQQALVARIKRLDGWLSRSLSVYGPNHRATKKAQHVMAQREPELAQRASVARVELQQQEQQRAKEASQQVARGRDVEQFEAMATKRRLNAGGWSDTGRSWRALPVPLQRMVEDFNKQPKDVQRVVLDKLRTDPKAAQELGQMLHANRSHGISR